MKTETKVYRNAEPLPPDIAPVSIPELPGLAAILVARAYDRLKTDRGVAICCAYAQVVDKSGDRFASWLLRIKDRYLVIGVHRFQPTCAWTSGEQARKYWHLSEPRHRIEFSRAFPEAANAA